MTTKHLFLFLITLISSISTLTAGNLYILYDGNCMDRLEYSYANNSNGNNYIAYHINVSDSEKVILDVGVESRETQNYLPAQLVQCNNAIFDYKLVNSINSQIDRVYLVRKKGRKKYSITPITFAAHYKRINNEIQYTSPKYKFQFDLERGAVGEDLNFVDPYAEIFFEGKIDYNCTGAYLFRQIAEYNNKPHTDLVFVPELGILEERSGMNVDDAFNNALALERINNLPVEEYFAYICNSFEDDFVEEVLPENGVASTQPSQNEPLPEEFLVRTPGSAVQTTAVAEYHSVVKGQTLYSISKKYGISVEQIRAWNGLGNSNTILVGQKLKVSDGRVANNQSSQNMDSRSNTNPGTSRPSATHSGSSAIKNNSTFRNTPKKSRIVTSVGTRISPEPEADVEIERGVARREPLPAPFESTGKRIETEKSRIAIEMPEETRTGQGEKYTREEYDINNNSRPSIQERSVQPSTRTKRTPRISGESIPDSFGSTPSSSKDKDRYHVLRQGETLAFVALKYDITQEQLRSWNGLRAGQVPPVGKRLIVKRTEEEQIYSDYFDRPTDFNEDSFSRTPKKKYTENIDTGSDIPQEYNTRGQRSTRSQQKANNSTSEEKVLYSSTGRRMHKIREGENLYQIAKKYGVTMEHLLEVNKFEPNEILIPFQKIYID